MASNTSHSQTVRLPISGMSCAACVSRVETALANTDGVDASSVNLATSEATITVADGKTINRAVVSIENAGYGVADRTSNITVGGMSCAACVSRVEDALTAVSGVQSVDVNLATNEATVRHHVLDENVLSDAIRTAGYTVSKSSETTTPNDRNLLTSRLISAAILSIAIKAVGSGDLLQNQTIQPALIALLATPVLFWCGWTFLAGFVSALRHGSANMNSLIAVGTLSAYGYSLAVTVDAIASSSPAGHLYFDTAAMIITFVLLGRLLEHHARTRTSDAIRSLMDLQPETARLVTDGGIEERPVDQVKVGQRIQVRPGDRIPVDGSVTKGVSSVDESLISGESMPVDKAVGDRVTAGSINKTGSFVFEATGVGSETALAHLIDLVKQAQSSRPPIQRLADRIAAVFVPLVFGIAAVTFGIWVAGMGSLTDAMVNAVAVLIISCPCALGLATPTAILVGTGKGAEHGLLIKAGDVIETAHQIQTVVLDKTGTLTLGRPAVTDILSLGERSEDDLLHLSASLEANSEHPIGIAIVEEAARRHLVVSAPDRFEAIAGGGVEGQVNGISVALGTERYLSASGVDTNREEMERLRQEGKTVVGVSVSGQIEGIIAVSDEIKPGAVEAVERLKEESIEVAMLTGDNIHAAEAVARSTGLDLVVADVLPEDKANRIKALQQDRGTVAMVGDGINDAPALAQADVGIAIGTGTDVAIESADVALMSGDLSGIPAIIRLSRRTMRIIRQNLFWAFAYNVILIPVAAMGWLTPWGGPTLAAAAMAFSSVTVVGNALRLKRFTP